jgi:hypothetical protein
MSETQTPQPETPEQPEPETPEQPEAPQAEPQPDDDEAGEDSGDA